MRSFDPSGMDPEVIAELDAIDATLAGEPVDPAHAELAELALLLADTTPRPRPEFASDLDRRVARRFEPVRAAAAGATAGSGIKGGPARARRRLLSIWTAGPAVALVAAGVAVVVVAGSGGFGSTSTTVTRPLGVVHGSPIVTHAAGVGLGASQPAAKSSAVVSTSKSATYGVATSSSGTNGAATFSAPTASEALTTAAPTPVPGTTGKVIQSASISLTTPNDRIDQVSQEVYNVVGVDGGSVTNSQITAATQNNGGGYASFTLSFPTSNLQAALTALSRLRFATVASRTDGTQNVGGQYNTDAANLQQAQALRTSLLKQLQDATTQTAIDAIEAQLKTANAQIATAQSTLASLQHKISHSTVTVQINSGGVVFPTPRPLAAKHGFTIARAGHDAVRVLVVSVGVALITLAVLVPLSLVVALVAWATMITRRRRREQALDAG